MVKRTKYPLKVAKKLLQISTTMDDPNPPFEDFYKPLFDRDSSAFSDHTLDQVHLPLIDLQTLVSGDANVREDCKAEIAKAAEDWGFFQVVNHGVTSSVLEEMRAEQARVFSQPFWKKQNHAFMNMSPGCYRWGTPTATSLRQLSWSEAFHIPLNQMSSSATLTSPLSCSLAMRKFANTVSELAMKLTAILGENLGQDSALFEETCTPSSCYLRMNRYPPCPNYSNVFGLMPHTDSDFLTVLHQDHVGGLQLVKDGRWIAVKPNPHALIINIGDLLQAGVMEFTRAWSIGWCPTRRWRGCRQHSFYAHLVTPSFGAVRSRRFTEISPLESIENRLKTMSKLTVVR